MKRLLALLVLLAIGGLALYYWKYKPGTGASTGPREALGAVGDAVGDKLHQTKVTGAVKAAFELNRDLEPYPIDVDADARGIVVLKGEVPREDVRATAGRVAAAVPDVSQVVNQLTVNPALPPPDGGGRTIGQSLDDKALEAKVNLAFSLNRELKGTDIGVKAYQRQVTLSGDVKSAAQRALAVEVARQTPNVAGVSDQLTVGGVAPATGSPGAASAPGERTLKAQQALAGNVSLAGYRIQVREEGGRLILTGRVKTAAEKDLAGLLARDAAGGPVENTVQVGP